MEPLNLSDGTHIPKGTFIAIAAASILMDPEIVPNPEEFDALRNYRKRLTPGQSTRHQYAMIDKDYLHFGHGKHACPGRALASNELKLILSHLILNYNIKYPAGKGRPINQTIDEMVFVDPQAAVLLKKIRKSIDRIVLFEG